jgi:hypothetical protein
MTHVKRSTYQKVVEENKQLKKDIKILALPLTAERVLLIAKWRKVFQADIDFDNIVKDACKKWVEDNPNDEVVVDFKKRANLPSSN